jgi:glycosyltransferase involved in cell wall biosynthesis
LIGYRKDVEQLVKKLGLENSVVITGEVQGEMKDALLANADVFVLPSYSENFAIVIAEAMAWGRPVIASMGTPWKEVADVGAGWWVAPEEEALAVALREALGKGREELDVMGAKGRALVSERYGWSVPANRLISSYKNILATAEGKLTRMNGFDKSRRLRRLD